jgi:hypothetical protein
MFSMYTVPCTALGKSLCVHYICTLSHVVVERLLAFRTHERAKINKRKISVLSPLAPGGLWDSFRFANLDCKSLFFKIRVHK